MNNYQIAAAIIRRGDEILLVEQQGKEDPASAWALPGGFVEDGELLTDALAREVREETGLTVRAATRLAYITQHDHPNQQKHPRGTVTVFIFEVDAWEGDVRIADPDGLILQARFVPIDEAIQQLEQTLSFRMMREPIVAYLRGQAQAGTMWFYRLQENGDTILIAKL